MTWIRSSLLPLVGLLLLVAVLAASACRAGSPAPAAVAPPDQSRSDEDILVRVPCAPMQSVVEVMVRPAFTTWEKVDCGPASVAQGERLVACWRLVEVPPVYQTRIKQAQPSHNVWRKSSEVRAEEEARAKEIAAVRNAPPPPEVPPVNRVVPPEGEPDGAAAGEVWCVYETAAGNVWRRHPECD